MCSLLREAEKLDLTDDDIGTVHDLLGNVAKKIGGRRLFVMDSKLLGLCEYEVCPGDIVCVWLGCTTPVVLRPQRNHYTYLCKAHIDGYMWGKAIDELDSGNLSLQEFEVH